MTLGSIAGNLLSAFIFAVVAFLAKKFWRYVKSTEANASAQSVAPKKSILKQFYGFLGCLALSTIIFSSISFRSGSILLLLLKIFSGLAMLFSFILVWGAFDAVVPFYPSDDVVQEPSDQAP